MGLRFLTIACGLAAAAMLALMAGAWRSALPAIDPPAADRFDRESLHRGMQLAAIGNCMTCHTADGGVPFAGGRPVPTPFGTLYSSNITPDPQTGIGRWSQSAFRRAMREGVSRTGGQLYPAFPYDHFTQVTDADDAALYAYVMTRRPFRSRPPANRLRFPFSSRPLLAVWKLMFLHTGAYRSDSAHDAQWNRGAYLVNGLAHCGACHTPRNVLGAEKLSARFAGGQAENWHAYAINSASPARVHWNEPALQGYFRDGWQILHGDAHGPMADVAANLSFADPDDVTAMATYIAWTMGSPEHGQPPSQPPLAPDAPGEAAADGGAAIFASACAGCHDGTRPLPFGGVRLSLSTAVMDDEPTNLIQVVLEGISPDEGAAGPIMPGFASVLSDEQLQQLLMHVRQRFGPGTPWKDLPSDVHAARAHRHD